jgi:transposase
VTDFLQRHPDGVVLAMDEMSLYFQATLTRVWCPIGQSPIVRISPDRDHLHYYGALNLRTGQEIALSLPALSSDHTLHFLDHILTCLPTQPILLLLDRAPWHTAKEVQQFLTAHPRLDFVFFPPACPDLNPQEHVWKQARQEVSHNHTFPLFPALCKAFRAFLDHTLFSFHWLDQYIPPSFCQFVFG